MSMPRVSGYVGLLGALAVALGVGAAIAASPGIAMADDGSATATGPSASSNSTGTGDASAAKNATADDQKTSGTAPDRQRDSSAESDAGESSSAADPDPEAEGAKPAKAEPTSSKRQADTPDADDATTTSKRSRLADPEPPAAQPIRAVHETVADADPPKAATPATSAVQPVQPTAAVTAVSPLGTPQQRAAEQLAAQTANSLPVVLMKLVLQFGFLSAAQQQFAQVGGPDRGNVDQLAAAVDEYAMGAAFQQQLLNSNDPTVVMQVAPPHSWYGLTVPGSRILYDNPDTIYRFMGVNAASSYVITGRFTGDRPADTSFSVLTGLNGTTASVLGGRNLVVGPDGSFTITASRDAAAPGQVNHLQLTNDSTLIATRNTLSDWSSEVPMTLSIQRVGGPPNSLFSQLGGFAIPGIGPLVVGNPLLTALVSVLPPMVNPPPLLRGLIAAVIMALGIQREATYMAVATTDPQTGRPIAPNVLKDPTRNAEFLATQLQSAGYFQLADDEAMVVTIDPGSAGYFVLPVTNDWTISRDYWNQQTSLNDAQAIANTDGTYTLVVSKADPGVANWVSTGGLNQGTISMRFQDLDPVSTDLPTVSSRVVPLDQVPTAVPAGTVYYTAAQRAAQLATRKAGFDNRFAPYPHP